MEGLIQWSPGVTLEAIEKQVILTAFRHYRGNKTTTSNALGISIRTLDSKLEKYAVDGKAEKEKYENERIKRAEFLARQRGPAQRPDGGSAPKNIAAPKNEGNPASPTSGIRMEPAQESSPQQTVSLSERKEVQAVSYEPLASSRPRKAR